MTKKVIRKAKKCPYCDSLNTIKKGKRKDIKKPLTRYKCLNCSKWFQEKRRNKNIKEKIWINFFWNKKTISELQKEFNKSRKEIQNIINSYQVKIKNKKPREVGLIIDVVFFNKRKNKTEFGMMIFYDVVKREPLIWKEVKNEKIEDYQTIFFLLKRKGFTFKYVVIDGKKGLREFFESQNTPIQYCQFHQLKIVRNYISNKPRLQSAKFLKEILKDFSSKTELEFREEMKIFIEIFKDEINEKRFNFETQRNEYVHKKLRSAIKSLKTNFKYLFTYQKYPEFKIPNTTNFLDGGEFSYLKRLLKNHNGCSKELKLKMINEYFENHKYMMKKRKKK